MIVNVINLPHRTDRLEHFLQQAKEQNFEYKRWEGIIHNIPATGISRAFKQIVRWAKENNIPSVCIAEDDIEFSSLGAWDYYIKNIPNEYDLYLGSVYAGDLDNGIVTWFTGYTLVIIHERFYDTFLSTNEGNNIDMQMKLHNGLYKVCQPFVCKQIDGYSDHARKITNYNRHYLAGKKFFTYQEQQKQLL